MNNSNFLKLIFFSLCLSDPFCSYSMNQRPSIANTQSSTADKTFVGDTASIANDDLYAFMDQIEGIKPVQIQTTEPSGSSVSISLPSSYHADERSICKPLPPITMSRNAIYTTEGPIAYFSKKDDIATCLINQINNAKNKIYAAVYLFNYESIANALIAAKSRGVNIDIIVDQKTKQLLLKKLTQNGIIIRVFNNTTSTSIMHNKFALFDNDKVWTGSFNWTYNGNTTNYENAVIITNQNLWVQFREEFEKIKAQTHLFQPSQKTDQQNSKKRKYDALSNNNQSENDSSYITNTVYH